MLTLTYVGFVVGLAVVAGLVMRRRGGSEAGVSAAERLRTLLVGAGDDAADDLVERMARCLVEQTTRLGSTYAIPGYLGVVLPTGLYGAACSSKPQLTDEVLARYAEMMVHRMGKTRREFGFPAGYVLRLVLTCGRQEAMVASWEPIVDVHAAFGSSPAVGPRPQATPGVVSGGRPRPTSSRSAPVVNSRPVTGNETRSSADEEHTVCQSADPAVDDDATVHGAVPRDAAAFMLSVDGVVVGKSRLGSGRSPVLVIGRGSAADLQCPATLRGISRRHAELTLAQGRVWLEDHSVNGCWLQKADGAPEKLATGSPVAVDQGDTIWLDEDHRATVTHS